MGNQASVPFSMKVHRLITEYRSDFEGFVISFHKSSQEADFQIHCKDKVIDRYTSYKQGEILHSHIYDGKTVGI